MDSPPVIPLQHGTRYILQTDSQYYFPYGNIPARDFLEFVPWEHKTPSVLVLCCGDIRSVFYTIWKNFSRGFENTFEAVQFTIHDESAAMLARNVLFLYLCIKLPKESVSRQKWLCAFWSIWFCHELLPDHEEILQESLKALLEFSENWSSPNNPLASLVEFFAPQMLIDMKHFWSMWCYEKVIASVKVMKSTRQKLIDKMARNTLCEAALGVFDLTDMMGSNLNKDIIEQMRSDYNSYIKNGSVFAEELTEEPTERTKVNSTFFEKPGVYKALFVQCPYRCFQQVYVTSVKTMVKAGMNVSHWDKRQADISNEALEKQPLLANSFLQFTTWVCGSADALQSRSNKVSFKFVCMEPIRFCYLCTRKFHIVFSYKLIDTCAPPAVLFAGIRLLRDGARFVCGSVLSHDVAKTLHKFIHECFGFPSKFLPVICGVRCINHEGEDYASIISSEHICLGTADTDPRQCSMREKLFIWEKCDMSPPLVMNSLSDCPEVCVALANCLNVCCSPLVTNVIGKMVLNNLCTDTACQILENFAAQLDPTVISAHEFWDPLCLEIRKNADMKAYFAAIQIETLLKGLHIHLAVDKSTCPICLDAPLSSYIGLFRMCIPMKQISDQRPLFSIFVSQEKLQVPTGSRANDSSAFLLAFARSLYRHSAHHIDCVGTVIGNILQLSCLAPLGFVENDFSFSLNEFTKRINDKGGVYTWPNMLLAHGKLKEYFVRAPLIPKCSLSSRYVAPVPFPLGHISRHTGNGDRFETTISLAEDKPELLTAKLNVQTVSPSQVKTICGDYSFVIKYPYPVHFKNLNLQRSKKSKTIVIKTQRRSHLYEDEGQLFYVNPEDHFTFPPVEMDLSNKELFMRMQYASKETMFKSSTANVCQLTLTVEQTIRQLLMSDDGVFIFISRKEEQLWGIVEVLNRIVDVARKVPALHVGYFFLDDVANNVREVVQRALYMGALQHSVRIIKIEFLKEPFQYLKKLFRTFSKYTQQSTRLAGTVVPTFEYQGCISQAVVYPLYQDPGRAVEDLQCGMCKAALKVESMDKCACEQVGYCNKVCKEKHRKEHSKECKLSTSKASAAENPKAPPKKPNPFKGTDGKYVCANCHKKITSLMACANCLKTWYCGRPCQKADWSKHKLKCAVAVAAMNGGLKCHNCQKNIRGERTKCTGCESVSYCSIPCQTSHWIQHKNECNGSARFVVQMGTQSQQKVGNPVTKKRATKAKKPRKSSKRPYHEEFSYSPETPGGVSTRQAYKGVYTVYKDVSKAEADAPVVELLDEEMPTLKEKVPKSDFSKTAARKTKLNVTITTPPAEIVVPDIEEDDDDVSLPDIDSEADDVPDDVSVPDIEADDDVSVPDIEADVLATNDKESSVSKQKKSKTKMAANIRCACCGRKPPNKPQRCARCHKVFYCGQECQKADWKEHKAICNKLSD